MAQGEEREKDLSEQDLAELLEGQIRPPRRSRHTTSWGQTSLVVLATLSGAALGVALPAIRLNVVTWIALVISPLQLFSGLGLLLGTFMAALSRPNIFASAASPLRIRRPWIVLYVIASFAGSAVLTNLVQAHEDNPLAWIPIFATLVASMVGLPSGLLAIWLAADSAA